MSYYFYSCWDIRFLALLIGSTILDFFIGIEIFNAKTMIRKKGWLLFSLASNLGILATFKYFNFFIGAASDLMELVNISNNLSAISIILPIGISFYTFHGMSYVFDIYNGKISPEKNILTYGLFVSFFPLLVAGPIERANHLLPQLEKKRVFSNSMAVLGLKQILWGLIKKLVIADNCGVIVDYVYSNYSTLNSWSILFGLICFSFQIYCDFSGYTDIAIGSGRLLGIDLIRNFDFPYFSTSIREFWRRWHISLTTWFRDYVYIPLGGRSQQFLITTRNVFIVFMLSGLWHGANYTFLVWAFLNFLFVVKIPFEKYMVTKWITYYPKPKGLLWEYYRIVRTFTLITLIWIFFRSPNIEESISIFTHLGKNINVGFTFSNEIIKICLLLVGLLPLFIVIEWRGRKEDFAIANILCRQHFLFRWTFYCILIYVMGMYMHSSVSQFIYFQF